MKQSIIVAVEAAKAHRRVPDFIWMAPLMVAAMVVTDLLQMPKMLSLNNVAFGDGGFDISVQAMMNRGYRAGMDFGYPYGALSLLYGKLWFSWLGLGPPAFFAGMVATDVIFALGLARFVVRTRSGVSGIALGLTGAVLSAIGTSTFAHGIERACICWALAEQVGGRRERALVLAIAAVLAKPSMGFIYGAWLIVLVVWELGRDSELTRSRLEHEFGPAVLTGGIMVASLSLIFGPLVVMRMLLPLAGAKAYHANGFGFLGRVGSTFWYFPGVHLGYYLGTPVTFWFAATAYLLSGAAVAARRLSHLRGGDRNGAIDETVVTCAVMHLAFVGLFFGSNASWTNYVYILIMGTAIISGWSGHFRTIAWLLILVGVVGQKGMVTSDLKLWTRTAPAAEAAGLWTSTDELNEWRRVLAFAQSGQAVVLSGDGAAQVLFQMVPPVAATLIHGQSSAAEVRRTVDLVRHARLVIVPDVPNSNHLLASWPGIEQALTGWTQVYRGSFFIVYRRMV